MHSPIKGSARVKPITINTDKNQRELIMTTEMMQTADNAINNAIAKAEQDQYLTFKMAEETYGIDILKIQEIRGWQDITQLPNAPEYIRGVMNLRGVIVPILDLRRRFQMEELEFTSETVVIVVNVMGRTIGLVVDCVCDVVDVTLEDMRSAPDFGSAIDASFIHGLSPMDGENMMIVLNVDYLLGSCELVKLDKLSDSGDSSQLTTMAS
jgi:purine-binding chemotaxis protein CheW